MADRPQDRAIPGSYLKLDCGCEFWTEIHLDYPPPGVFVMMPCSPDCQWYRYALEQSRAAGNPVDFKTEQDHFKT